MSVALQKLDGVASVTVTLNNGEAKLTLKPGNTITLADVRKVIEKNGFTPKSAAVVGDMEAVAGKDGTVLRVTGTNEVLPIATKTSEKLRSEAKARIGSPFVVRGVVGAPKDDPTGSIEVSELTSSAKEEV